jgi:two-component sensor histidine kinase
MTAELSRRSLPKEGKPELSPEEAALVTRIGVFVTMRWLAIAGVLIASLLATRVFNISFPLLPIYIICAVMAVYNFVLFLQARGLAAEASGSAPQGLTMPLRRLMTTLDHIPTATSPLVEKARVMGNLHIALDLVALTSLLHFTGGIENPFIFYFVFHVIIAGVLLHYRIAYLIATVAIFLILLLVGLEYVGVLPHVHLEGFVAASLYKQGTYILGILLAPLSAVQSYLRVMLGGFAGEMAEKQKHMIERSSHRITELLELISDLLDVSRIEGGQIVREMEEISLPKVVEVSVENVSSLASEKKIKLGVEIAKDLPKLQASGVRLQQVITNLLSNATKFTPERGEIKLRISDQKGDIQVEVMDTGVGIPTEELPKIFDDFYRVDVEKGGTGLGLSIAKRIVEAHEGKIWAESPNTESKSGRGSNFIFTLPKSLVLATKRQDEEKPAKRKQ